MSGGALRTECASKISVEKLGFADRFEGGKRGDLIDSGGKIFRISALIKNWDINLNMKSIIYLF